MKSDLRIVSVSLGKELMKIMPKSEGIPLIEKDVLGCSAVKPLKANKSITRIKEVYLICMCTKSTFFTHLETLKNVKSYLIVSQMVDLEHQSKHHHDYKYLF